MFTTARPEFDDVNLPDRLQSSKDVSTWECYRQRDVWADRWSWYLHPNGRPIRRHGELWAGLW